MAPTRTTEHGCTSDLPIHLADRRSRREAVPVDGLALLVLALHHSGQIPCPSIVTFDSSGTVTGALACVDPVTDLWGTLAAESVEFVGVLALGTAHGLRCDEHSDPSVDASAPDTRGEGVRLSTVTGRTGRSSSHVELLDRSPVATDRHGPAGLLVDALRRSMQLPTDPVDFGIEPLLSVLWLEAIEASLDRGTSTPTWSQLASLHPAVLTHDEGPFDDLVERCELVAASSDWESIRTSTVAGHTPFGIEVGRDDLVGWASWFDAPSFARALLAEHLPVPHLVDDICRRLEPALAHRVSRSVAPFAQPLHHRSPLQPHRITSC